MSFSEELLDAAVELLTKAQAKSARVATAESCTGGLVSALLTDIAGSSRVVDCGFVTYSNAAKVRMLGVPQEALDAHGAVSEPVALAMAEGALDRSDATIAVSITGVAGPGATGSKPEGRVCFGLAQTGSQAQSHTIEFGPLGRQRVREASAHQAIALLIDTLAQD